MVLLALVRLLWRRCCRRRVGANLGEGCWGFEMAASSLPPAAQAEEGAIGGGDAQGEPCA